MWGLGFCFVCLRGWRWKTLTGFGSLSLDNAGLKASRERGDGASPPPRPGSMVGHTGPSSVIGSNKVGCAVRRRRMQEGESPGSIPHAGVRGIQFAACIQEPGVAVSPVLFDEADGEPRGPRLRAAPFRSMGRVAPLGDFFSTVQGVFHRLGSQGRATGT